MKKQSKQIDQLRPIAFVMDAVGRSRAQVFRDMKAGLLEQSTKIGTRNYWRHSQVARYVEKLVELSEEASRERPGKAVSS